MDNFKEVHLCHSPGCVRKEAKDSVKIILKSDFNYTDELVRKNILVPLHTETFSNR